MRADVCVATVTWARDDEEEQLLRRALTALSRAELPVTVADKGSRPAFAAFLGTLPGFALAPPVEPTLVGQVRASLRTASAAGRAFVLYTESDKEQFFGHGLDEFLAAAPRDDSIGVVLAARSTSSFATYPPFQQYCERAINGLWAQFTGEEADYSYGPLLINRALVPAIDLCPPDLSWGWRHLMVGVARRLGYRVLHIRGDYPCPPDQYEEPHGERLHRMKQLAQNVDGAVLSMTVPLPA